MNFRSGTNGSGALPQTEADFAALRRAMVADQIARRGIKDQRVLDAVGSVPRHAFVPPAMAVRAYADEPLAIGEGQTISQPYMVAAMAEALELEGTERVLEVGAGSGYQAAVLSLLAREVIAMEALETLTVQAQERLARLGYLKVRVIAGDGTFGWPAAAPYEAILVSAAAPAVPPPLKEQLAEGGRLVIPVGTAEYQKLHRLRKQADRFTDEGLFSCQFVPLRGRYGWTGPAG